MLGMRRRATPLMTFLKKILLVNHDPEVTCVVRQLFEHAGHYLVREETDDRLALHVARWFRPDLIVIDGGSGSMEAEFKTIPFLTNIPIVSLTVAPQKGVVSSGVLSGYSFFATPLSIDEAVRGLIDLLR